MRGPFWPCGPCRQSYPKALRGENWWQVARAQVVAVHQSEDKPSPDGDIADTAHNLSVAYSFFQPRASGHMARNLWLFECDDSLSLHSTQVFRSISLFFFIHTAELWILKIPAFTAAGHPYSWPQLCEGLNIYVWVGNIEGWIRLCLHIIKCEWSSARRCWWRTAHPVFEL